VGNYDIKQNASNVKNCASWRDYSYICFQSNEKWLDFMIDAYKKKVRIKNYKRSSDKKFWWKRKKRLLSKVLLQFCSRFIFKQYYSRGYCGFKKKKLYLVNCKVLVTIRRFQLDFEGFTKSIPSYFCSTFFSKRWFTYQKLNYRLWCLVQKKKKIKRKFKSQLFQFKVMSYGSLKYVPLLHRSYFFSKRFSNLIKRFYHENKKLFFDKRRRGKYVFLSRFSGARFGGWLFRHFIRSLILYLGLWGKYKRGLILSCVYLNFFFFFLKFKNFNEEVIGNDEFY